MGRIEIPQRSSLLPHRGVLFFGRKHGRHRVVKRREFISLIGVAAAWPLAARAQQAPPRILRVGTASPNTRTFPFWMAFDQRMRELGYIEGQNLAFEFIHTGDRVDRMSEAIRDLVRRKVDIIVESSGNEQGLKEAIAATSTLPIVMIAI